MPISGANLNVEVSAAHPAVPHFSGMSSDACVWQDRLVQATELACDRQQLLEAVAGFTSNVIQPDLIATFSCATERIGDQSEVQILVGPSSEIDQAMLSALSRVGRAACEAPAATVRELTGEVSGKIAAVPIPQAPGQCLLAAVTSGTCALDEMVVVLQLVAAHISRWDLARQREESESTSRQLAALQELAVRVEAANDPDQACRILVNELKSYLGSVEVIAGLCKEGSENCQVVAISGVDTIQPHTEQVRFAQAVLQESIARGELSVWPPVDDENRQGLLAHRQYLNAVAGEILISSPLRETTGKIRGAWLFVDADASGKSQQAVNFVRAAESPVASALGLLARAQKGRLHQAFSEGLRLAGRRRGRFAIAAIGLVFALMMVPVRYRAKCDSQLEPVTRRYVAAPFDGLLEEPFVEPGDVISVDQLLARMDGREIRWELAGTRADLHRASKERAGHVASHDSGKAHIAKHEVSRLQHRIDLLEHRNQNLEIRSSIRGIVVSGDLQDAQGMPLKIGQTMFEIAPLDEMVVEIAIPESDIGYVKPGMPVCMHFDAFPLRRFEATLQRIHPRAELKETENVFIAEVSLENDQRDLRPGMRGTAAITAGRYPLGWNLFRRPLAGLLTWLGW